MPRFRFSAYASDGSLEKGEIQADSDLAALSQLSARGLTPVTLEEGAQALPWWQRELSWSGKPKARANALEQFFKTLSGLLSVEFGLLKALGFCATNNKDRTMAKAIDRLQQEVREGSTLAAAMGQANGYFPERLVTMIEIGETADQLASVTSKIARTLSSEAEHLREIRSALIYPIILAIMSLLVLALLVFFLSPTLAPIFASADAEMPFILGLMEALRHFLIANWGLMLIIATALLAAMKLFSGILGKFVSKIASRLPVLGSFMRQSETLKAFQTLGLMLSSGAPLNQAVKTVSTTTRNPLYRRLFETTLERVTAGGRLSEPLITSPLIDPMAARMIEAGEESNRLVSVLDETVKDLSERSSLTLNQSVKLITPVFTLVIGLTVGSIILSTISAIMSLNDVAF